jgi:DNA-binding response OmpR family regulator
MEAKLKILVAEDDKDDVIVLKRRLSKHLLTICNSAKEFFELLEIDNYDFIIMDIGLPGSKSGLDIIKDIRKIEKYNSVPIICTTSHAYSKSEMLVREAGAQFYLIKPFKKEILLAIIEGKK